MKIINKPTDLLREIAALKGKQSKIGFVPTMGALHSGHLALVKKSVEENDICIVSIFVNPTQFNNKADLEKYPRSLEQDAFLLEKAGCHLIFAPSDSDIYTDSEMKSCFEFDFGGLDKVMEGRFRPGHFNGVVQIVSKLFDFVQPDNAYFGEKDFQQLAIIHRMVKLLNYNIKIVDCPIIREESGLAMSSRNERLTPAQRKNAAKVSVVLSESRNFVHKMNPLQLIQWVTDKINQSEDLRVEYYDIVDVETLQSVINWDKPSVGCIAVFCGDVRLIDNIRY